MVTALILAIVVVLVLAFAAQRLMDNEATITPTTTMTSAK
jgi:hypothetical protein